MAKYLSYNFQIWKNACHRNFGILERLAENGRRKKTQRGIQERGRTSSSPFIYSTLRQS